MAKEFLKKLEKEQRAEATLTKQEWLLGLAMGDIGSIPISEISAIEILEPLRRIEARGNYETARRTRAVIGQVFRYAIATVRAENDPTFGLKGVLITLTVTHRAALTEKDGFARLVKAIWNYEGRIETRFALQLMALFYPRPGELRKAEWQEIDFEKAVWTIPASRMKMRREHRKPLSGEALAILEELKKYTGAALPQNNRTLPSSRQAPIRCDEKKCNRSASQNQMKRHSRADKTNRNQSAVNRSGQA